MKMSRTRRIELAAIFLLILWVVAWIVSLLMEVEVPTALNAVMPMASAALLGFQLPIDTKRKDS